MIKLLSILIFFIQFLPTGSTQTQLLPKEYNNFNTTITIETQDAQPYLLAYIELNNNSYVISPFSMDTFYGKVTLELDDDENLSFDGALSESPISKEEYDPILETKVKFVRVNTRYKQALKILTKEDFKEQGTFWFLLEPQCNPYQVLFTIEQKKGLLEITETKTSRLN